MSRVMVKKEEKVAAKCLSFFCLKKGRDMSSVFPFPSTRWSPVRATAAYMVSLLPSKPDFPLPLRFAKVSKQNEIIPHPSVWPTGLRHLHTQM